MKAKTAIAILILLLVAGLIVFLIVYNQPEFTGKRIKNPDSYMMDIKRMNGTDSHTLKLKAGDVLRTVFKTEKGLLHLEIRDMDGSVLYTGNGKETTDFRINIPETGIYIITVEAHHAKGTVHVQLNGESK